MKVYGYDKCSTCRKAYQFLDKRGVDYEKIDITQNPPSLAELKKMLGFYSGDLKRLFNTSGQAYRELKISERLPNMSESEALKLLSKNGRLVKRPFVLATNAGAIGFKEPEWKSLIR